MDLRLLPMCDVDCLKLQRALARDDSREHHSLPIIRLPIAVREFDPLVSGPLRVSIHAIIGC